MLVGELILMKICVIVGYDKWKNYTDLGGNRPTNVVLATANMLFYYFWCFCSWARTFCLPFRWSKTYTFYSRSAFL